MSKIKTVAIIGGGISGLSAAGLLSRKGLRVKLFEANDKLGGCCANTNIGKYTFHDGALYLALPGILDHVFERLGIDRPSLLPLRKLNAVQTTTLPDGTIVTQGNGFDITIERRNGNVDKVRLQQELHHMMNKWNPVLRLFEDDIMLHPFSLSKFIAKGWRHLHKFRGTVASELNSLISDDAVRAAMAGTLLFAGVPVEKLPVLSILGLISLIGEGLYLPEGGMGRIPQVLSKPLKENGGEIFLNSKVNKIVVKNGRVYGVEVEGRGLVEADAVISTASGMATFEVLMNPENVPQAMKRKAQNAPLSHKALSIQLGLSKPIDVPSHLNSVLPLMEEQYKVFMLEKYGVKWLNYSVPTKTVQNLASPGASIVEMYIPIVQDDSIEKWNEEKKERIAEEAIAALSRLHNIDIAVKRIRNPKDFQNDMHLYKGAIYGLSPAADLKAQFPHKTSIPGLYLTGQTTYPGFGVSSSTMSGIFAAETLMNMAGKND